MIYIFEPDRVSAQSIQTVIGEQAPVLDSAESLRWQIRDEADVHAIVVGPSVSADSAFHLADGLRLTRPATSVILVRRRVETTVLTGALRSGVREVVSEREPSELRSAVARARDFAHALHSDGTDAERAAAQTGRGQVVTIFSAKGGCGKTTSAVNLALSLAAGGDKKVCLVDLDLAFGDVGVALGLPQQRSIADALTMGENLDEGGIKELLTEHSPGMSVLLAPPAPEVAESITGDSVRSLLQSVRGMFDYVVIDTAPAFNDHILAAFDLSDLIVLVATMDVPTLKNLKLAIETLDVLQYPRNQWRLLLNRADENVGLSASDIEKVLGLRIDGSIPLSREVPAAVNRGRAVALDKPKHPVSVAYRHFASTSIASTPLKAGSPAPQQSKSTARASRRFFRRRALAS